MTLFDCTVLEHPLAIPPHGLPLKACKNSNVVSSQNFYFSDDFLCLFISLSLSDSLSVLFQNSLLPLLEIPSPASNSFNHRLPQRSNSISLDSSSLFDLSSHWPVFFRLTNLTHPYHDLGIDPTTPPHSHTQSCPYHQHMLLWGASPHEPISVKIIDISSLPEHLSPQPGEEILHYSQFPHDLTFSSINSSSVASTSFIQTTLIHGEYLFIPNTAIAVFDQPETQIDLLKFCYFDASNIHRVRTSLLTESLLWPSALHLLKVLSSPTLFDFSMNRNPPSHLRYAALLPQRETISAETTLSVPEEPVVTIEPKESKNRRNRGKNDFRG
jgi:hypothetical protein